jgi:DNA-binding GntR family transcriptional regulator
VNTAPDRETSEHVPDDLNVVEPLTLGDGQRAPGVIYEHLRELILDGRLPPGFVISQVALATRLGVSRTPLREALRWLQQEGLIEAEPNRRARVVGFDPEELEVVYSTRIFYEPLALMQTLPRMSEDDIELISDALAGMRRASAENDYQAWQREHTQFHSLLALHAPSTLKRQIDVYSVRAERYRRMFHSSVSRNWNVGDPEHEAILLACRERDADLAAGQLARHLASVAIALLARVVPEREPTLVRFALRIVGSSGGSAPGANLPRRLNRS